MKKYGACNKVLYQSPTREKVLEVLALTLPGVVLHVAYLGELLLVVTARTLTPSTRQIPVEK